MKRALCLLVLFGCDDASNVLNGGDTGGDAVVGEGDGSTDGGTAFPDEGTVVDPDEGLLPDGAGPDGGGETTPDTGHPDLGSPDAAGPECEGGDDCGDGQICTAEGHCVQRCAPQSCEDGFYCGVDGECHDGGCPDDEACLEGAFCDESGRCLPGCRADECPEGQVCDGNHICVLEVDCLDTEICGNGEDDDCDGEVDDPGLCNAPCVEDAECDTGGVGACGVGVIRCPEGGVGPGMCLAVNEPAEAERCDGVDDDCDGETDEGFDLGEPCAGGVGACVGRGILGCGEDGEAVCTFEGDPERCNGIDDDCDGETDEDFADLNAVCEAGEGVCAVQGRWRCAENGDGLRCDANVGEGSGEVCDALDNDCDGRVDEDYPALGTPCTVGLGACAAEGTTVCAGADRTRCDAETGDPSVEECNGIDDDCDGLIDEGPGNQPLSEVCYEGLEDTRDRGECRAGRRTCADGEWGACVGQVIPELETCDGLDNDCNGIADDGPDGPLQVECYTGPEGTAGQGICQPGLSTCTFGVDGPCVGEITPRNEICDTEDNDCNGEVDEVEGSCACEAGTQQDCYSGPNLTAGTGACVTGVQTCAEDGSAWGRCEGEVTPSVEVCDDVDNNCNGEADEALIGVGIDCVSGVGACAVRGTGVCRPGNGGVVCDAEANEPSPEACDNADNDCDGRTDEDFDVGGDCGRGIGECLRQGITRCNVRGEVICAVVPGFPGGEACDGLDNDCDGQIDEDFQVGQVCSAGVGACMRRGQIECDGVQGSVCNAEAVQGEVEICDGADNDCDGDVDEGFQLGSRCEIGAGVCRSAGVLACAEDGGTRCDAPVVVGTAELCNGEDDDCDGRIDEGLPPGRRCETGEPGQCRVGHFSCVDGQQSCVADLEPSDEVCDGLDNNCDGEIDEGFGTIQCGVGECQQEIPVCSNGRIVQCDPLAGASPVELCNGVDDDCDGEIDEDAIGDGAPCEAGIGACRRVARTTCVDGALVCNAVPGAPSIEVCDWEDNDCDGTIDEEAVGVGVQCGAGIGACRGVADVVCLDGVLVCPAEELEPGEEICDGLDNDCDGLLDEGFGSEVCGVGQCRHAVPNCEGGGEPPACDPLEGASDEVCDGIDNDCDGMVDEDPVGLGEACPLGLGECRREGTTSCRNGSIVCSGYVGVPRAEVCDLLDNDCDGEIDEDPVDEGQGCAAGVGACARNGLSVCVAGSLRCDAEPGAPAEELCNNVDDDCDGELDEGFGAVTCGLGICRHTVSNCQGGEEPPVCDPLEGQRPELCNGLDDDCDGEVDEDSADVGADCAEGIGACRVAAATVCEDGVEVCGAVAGEPGVEECNGVDDNCDGRVDEGNTCPDETGPTVIVHLSGQIVDVGTPIVITIRADDPSGIAAIRLAADNRPLNVDGNGQARYIPETAGFHEILAEVEDGAGNVTQERATLRVLDPNDQEAPVARIVSPEADAELMGRTAVVGEAVDDNLFEYRLEMREKGGDEWVTLERANEVPENGVLGYFDPTLLENGMYVVRLRVEDVNGRISQDERVVVADGEAKVGAFTITYTDATLPVAGMPLTVERTYDSRVPFERDFGRGWTLSIKQGKFEHNRAQHTGYRLLPGNNFLRWPCQQTAEDDLHTTELRVSDRERYVFHLEIDAGGALLGGCEFSARYTYVHGTVPGAATLQIIGDNSGLYLNGSQELVTWDFDEFEVRGVRLTTPDKRVFDFHLDRDGIFRVEDQNANQVQIQPNGLFHSAGQSVDFERDRAGRITRVLLPDGNDISYSYDADGHLVAVTDELGNVTRYRYNGFHQLTDIIDPSGSTPARQIYDDDGRMVAIEYPDGHRVAMDHDTENRVEVVRDRLGAVEVFEYDEAGRVLSHTDKAGNTTTNEYDDAGNLVRKTEPGDAVTTYEYTAGRMTRLVDPLGNERTAAYNARNQAIMETDLNGGLTSKEYDARGNLTRVEDAEGGVTAYTYDAKGNRLTKTDALGNTTIWTYTDQGYVESETDALGNVATYTYDEEGNRLTETREWGDDEAVTRWFYDAKNRVVRTVDALGGAVRVTYDERGRKTSETDPRGFTTRYEYDDLGNNTAVRYADGTSESYTYDAEGRRISITDRGGRTRRVEYDEMARPVRTLLADGGAIGKAYDVRGNLIRETDARGNETAHEYDAANRRVRTIDALGQVTLYEYDAKGNRTAVTGPDGRTTRYEYDALDREVAVVFEDDTRIVTEYDAVGNQVARTDQAGRTTRWEYDALSRLVAVTDALGGVTRYEYDALGNRVAETDANGHATRYEFDALGRATGKTLPGGESMSAEFDALGNTVSRTDYNGETTEYTYDSNGKLTSITLPDGTVERATYTPSGQRATVVDARGVTRWTYDVADRVTSRTDPDGQVVRWTYDVAGNRTSVTSRAGTTRYEFDELNRMVGVEHGGAEWAYAYDAAGNRSTLAQPNGLVTTYGYDELNRLVSIETRLAGELVAGYSYTLGAAGNRTELEELHTGRVVAYEYDALYRLTGESEDGGRAIAYTYDAMGNRLTRDDSVDGATAYEYDENDRLTLAGDTAYEYDANGNVTGMGDVTYAFDSRNRLVEVVDGARVASFGYDIDGNRITRTIEEEGAEPTTTRYVVDENRRFTQVLAEVGAGGVLDVGYVFGSDPLARVAGGATGHYVTDGQLSVRHLTDGAGAVTDSYTYDAFGRTLASEGETPNDLLYTGEFLDPNVGFYYLRARWMNPDSGRFQSVEPEPGMLFEPQSLHRYSYVTNSPVDRVDPSGRFGIVSVSISISINFNLRSIYTTNLVKTFLVATRIIVCQLGPAFALRNAAFNAIASDSPGAWSMLAASQKMIGDGFRALGGALAATYENIANDLVSFKFDIDVDLNAAIDALQAQLGPGFGGFNSGVDHVQDILKAIDDLQQFKQKVDKFFDEAKAWYDTAATLIDVGNTHTACEKAKALEKVGNKLIEYVPGF